MKFLALNVDLDGLSIYFLRYRKPAHEGIKEWYPFKSRYFTAGLVFREIGCRWVWACCLSQQALVTSFLVVSTSITMKDPELPKKGFKKFFFNFRLRRTL